MKRLIWIFAVMALVVAACGGGAATETTGADAAATETSDAGEAGESDAGEEGAELSDDASDDDGELTLDDFIPGFSRSSFEEVDWRSEELRAQQLAAECMAAEGFEYIPFVPSDVGGGFGFDEFDREEYVKEFGFGVATWVLMDDAFGYEEPEDDPWADDPNIPIVEAMDELEREEYYRVLHGEDPFTEIGYEEFEAMTPEEQEAFMMEFEAQREPGCMEAAWESTYEAGESEAFYEEFSADLDAFYERDQSDPKMVELQTQWSACMAEKGHNFADQEEMYAYFYGDEYGEGPFSQQVSELIVWPEPDPSLFEDLEEGEEPDFDPSLFAPQYDIELLQPLIDEEIAVATADFECSKGMDEAYEEIYKALEAQFIEENLDRLLAFKESHS